MCILGIEYSRRRGKSVPPNKSQTESSGILRIEKRHREPDMYRLLLHPRLKGYFRWVVNASKQREQDWHRVQGKGYRVKGIMVERREFSEVAQLGPGIRWSSERYWVVHCQRTPVDHVWASCLQAQCHRGTCFRIVPKAMASHCGRPLRASSLRCRSRDYGIHYLGTPSRRVMLERHWKILA